MAAAVRRSAGYLRYALSCQYHGESFLGFSYQGQQENCILPDGTDLRGYRSVEGRIREALDHLFGRDNQSWENIQVSSRTDRGVHALKNTFHVDIKDDGNHGGKEILSKLHRGLNFHLTRQTTIGEHNVGISGRGRNRKRKLQKPGNNTSTSMVRYPRSGSDELRILNAVVAPDYMANPFSEQDPSQPTTVDWNARFSATERTYIYRLLYFSQQDTDSNTDWGVPFEFDRSWRLRGKTPINVEAMQEAAHYLEGFHDFSTFRGANCQRQSPIINLKSVQVHGQPYGPPLCWGGEESTVGGLLGLGGTTGNKGPYLVTIKFVGNSFLYRQVRNMVGCLVDVGCEKLDPHAIPELMQARDRSQAPRMAPAHGLFLVDVRHGDFQI